MTPEEYQRILDLVEAGKPWSDLDGLEMSAREIIETRLELLHRAVRFAYMAGGTAPDVPGRRRSEPDVKYAALFLRRTLIDLRSVWLLARSGYTSQAVTVASTLFEHSLVVCVVAGSPEQYVRLRDREVTKNPWNARELCQLYAKGFRAQGAAAGLTLTDEQEKRIADGRYEKTYEKLCRLKHPNRWNIEREQGAAAINGRVTIAAAPDTTDEGNLAKGFALWVAAHYTNEAARQFVIGLDVDQDNLPYRLFYRCWKEVPELLRQVHQDATDGPGDSSPGDGEGGAQGTPGDEGRP